MPSELIGSRVATLYELQSAWLEPKLKEMGVRWTTFQLLATIFGAGDDARQAEVARRLGVSPATLSESRPAPRRSRTHRASPLPQRQTAQDPPSHPPRKKTPRQNPHPCRRMRRSHRRFRDRSRAENLCKSLRQDDQNPRKRLTVVKIFRISYTTFIRENHFFHILPSRIQSDMIRIVGLQRDPDPRQEFVLLQNQGGMRVQLRGHALVSESAVQEPAGLQEVYVISEDVLLQPGQYALVRTCTCNAKWSHQPDGYSVYYVGLGRQSSIWSRLEGPLHILAPQHTYCERTTDPLLVKS